MSAERKAVAQIGDCAVCSRRGVRVHHIRSFGDLTSGRLACVDERACFNAYLGDPS